MGRISFFAHEPRRESADFPAEIRQSSFRGTRPRPTLVDVRREDTSKHSYVNLNDRTTRLRRGERSTLRSVERRSLSVEGTFGTKDRGWFFGFTLRVTRSDSFRPANTSSSVDRADAKSIVFPSTRSAHLASVRHDDDYILDSSARL